MKAFSRVAKRVSPRLRRQPNSGISFIEVLVVLGIVGIVFSATLFPEMQATIRAEQARTVRAGVDRLFQFTYFTFRDQCQNIIEAVRRQATDDWEDAETKAVFAPSFVIPGNAASGPRYDASMFKFEPHSRLPSPYAGYADGSQRAAAFNARILWTGPILQDFIARHEDITRTPTSAIRPLLASFYNDATGWEDPNDPLNGYQIRLYIGELAYRYWWSGNVQRLVENHPSYNHLSQLWNVTEWEERESRRTDMYGRYYRGLNRTRTNHYGNTIIEISAPVPADDVAKSQAVLLNKFGAKKVDAIGTTNRRMYWISALGDIPNTAKRIQRVQWRYNTLFVNEDTLDSDYVDTTGVREDIKLYEICLF